MSYQDYKTKVVVEVMGQRLEIPLCQFVEGVDNTLIPIRLMHSYDDSILLEFIACLDSYQEDSEFTESLAKMTTTTYTDWIVEADIKNEDSEWYKEVVEFYKGIVKKLEEK